MRITKNLINKALEDAIVKCRPTIAEQHNILDSMSSKEKDTLLYYAGIHNKEYSTILGSGDEDEIFNYERQIFKIFNKTQRKNILNNLVDFNEADYQRDKEVGYPNDKRGKLERRQEKLQEAQGMDDKKYKDAFGMWTGGYYEEIQKYVQYGTIPSSAFYDGYEVKTAGDNIREFIQGSVGLDVNTLLFRGGFWEVGMKVGDIGTIPCLNSLTYSKDTAYDLGIETDAEYDPKVGDFVNPPDKYLMDVYCDEGTKGAMVNAPSLSHKFPEHEYLIDKGMRYIVLAVDDEHKTAKIKLLPPTE